MKTAIVAATVMLLGIAPFTCSPESADWGLAQVEKIPTPPDPPLQCSFAVPTDIAATQRASCAFGQGDHAVKTLGVSPALATQIPIRHIIIMMKENRSFDHLFGHLHDLGQPAAEAIPADASNLDRKGVTVTQFHEPTTCVDFDPGHQSAAVSTAIAHGGMTGFVKSAAETTTSDGHFVMGNYTDTDLPFYYWLANTYALGDRHFGPTDSGTFANRGFFIFATNDGAIDTGITYPDPATPSIMELILNAGYSWRAYSDSEPMSGTLGWHATTPGVRPFPDLLTALDEGTLPNVAFVDAEENITDDHPTGDLQAGEVWSKQIYDHAVTSPQWSRLAIVFTHDEAGGFYDHVPPPTACQPKPSASPDTHMGPRVPLIMISRWAKAHSVSHVVRDHTAITRFIETVFDLPALTARDANAESLFDMLDFSCAQPETPPTSPPSPGVGGCTRTIKPPIDTQR